MFLNTKASPRIAFCDACTFTSMLAVFAMILSFVTTQPISAQTVCFDFEQSNCGVDEHFIDLRGDAPSHYKVFFGDSEAYFAENIFQQYEYLTSTFLENLPYEPIKYDYNSAYTDLSNVTIFGHKPLFIELESWGPYIGCCFSDEYSAYFDADGFEMSDKHEAYTKLYFCRTDQVSRSDFAEALSRAEFHSAIPLNVRVNAVVHIQCGRRFLRYNQDTLSFTYNAEIVQ